MTHELCPITAPELAPLQHGFFTRQGGVSGGLYSGLNCGRGSSDQPGAVARNRDRVAQHLGVPTDHLLSLYQIHSTRVIHVTGPLATPPQADALVTATPGIALGALSADCAPILFADMSAGVIGAAHSGWKGTLHGIGTAVLDAMEALGARRETTTAVIGPTISQAAYEVGPEFRQTFLGQAPDQDHHFLPGTGDRLQFDLPGFIAEALRRADIGAVRWTGDCTYADEARFFSYRRATHRQEPDYGRLISAIRL